jgi:hypothetical protein
LLSVQDFLVGSKMPNFDCPKIQSCAKIQVVLLTFHIVLELCYLLSLHSKKIPPVLAIGNDPSHVPSIVEVSVAFCQLIRHV